MGKVKDNSAELTTLRLVAQLRGETAQVVKGKKLNHWHLHRAGGAGLKLMVHQEGQDGPWNGPHTAREGSS